MTPQEFGRLFPNVERQAAGWLSPIPSACPACGRAGFRFRDHPNGRQTQAPERVIVECPVACDAAAIAAAMGVPPEALIVANGARPPSPMMEESPSQEPLPEEVTLVEALLEQFVSDQNPWDYIHAIDEHRVPAEFRHRFYQQFITLVSLRPQAEQDALLSAGQPVFRYRTETARRDIAALRTSGGQQVKITPSVVCDEWMAEIVHVPGQNPPIKYLVFRNDGATELADEVEMGGVVYRPPQVENENLVMLPSGVEEYGSERSLVEAIVEFILGQVHFSDLRKKFVTLVAAYIIMTWAYDRFEAVPYLRFLGDWGTAKSRLLQICALLCFRSIRSGGSVTPALVFRAIDLFKGTLIIDESDFDETSPVAREVMAILRCGYMKDFPVLRNERRQQNDGLKLQGFDCYGPKIFANRENWQDQALESRCATLQMELHLDVPDTIPLFLSPEDREHAVRVRNTLLAWRFARYRSISVDPRGRVPGIELRGQQVALPLAACLQDEKLRHTLIELVREITHARQQDQIDSFEARVVRAMISRSQAEAEGHWRVADVAGFLNLGLPEREWANEKKVGRAMKQLGFKPLTVGNRAAYGFDGTLLHRQAVRYDPPPRRQPVP